MADDHIIANLDDYLDGRLSAEQRARVDSHLQGCEVCRTELATARRLCAALSALPVAEPDPSFFENALRRARTGQTSEQQQHSAPTWMPAALVAGLLVMLVGGLLLRQPGIDAGDPAAVAAADITMALEEAKTVNLVFASEHPLDNVILTVDLPDGVELKGYPGRMQMRWATSLQPGKNRLPLELIAIGGTGGELVATMRSADTEKVFRISVDVVDG